MTRPGKPGIAARVCVCEESPFSYRNLSVVFVIYLYISYITFLVYDYVIYVNVMVYEKRSILLSVILGLKVLAALY